MQSPKVNSSRTSQVAWIVWNLGRPWWRWALAAFAANTFSALFEGTTLGLFAIALHSMSGPIGISIGGPVERLWNWLQGSPLSPGRETIFLGLILLGILSQILRSGFQFLGEVATVHLQAGIHAQGYNRIFSRIMRLPFSQASSYRLGDLTDYLNQSDRLYDMVGRLNNLTRAILLVLIYGCLLLWLSWPMTLLAIGAYWLVSKVLHKVLTVAVRHSRAYTESTGALSWQATEFLQAIRLLHTFARQENAISTVEARSREKVAKRRQATLWTNAVEPITEILTVAAACALLVVGFLFLDRGGSSRLPHLLAFFMTVCRVTPRLRSMNSDLAVLASLTPNVARMIEILYQEEDLDSRPGGKRAFPGFRQSIEFRNVSLRYLPDEPAAVLDLSFRLPRGSFTALVGVSGVGKSSVADLLLRLFEPTSGQILVDGIDLQTVDRRSWRTHLGVVSQDPFLFHASIRDNITFGKPDATKDEIVSAARASHAEEFIGRLAGGYETVIGDRGYRLSGGQCQRIALARALAAQPEILILDEATSALDSESERFIQQTLDEQRGRRTVLVIAHRISTVSRADQILVLAEGRLVEQGTHLELLERKGIYARLCQLQSENKMMKELTL